MAAPPPVNRSSKPPSFLDSPTSGFGAPPPGPLPRPPSQGLSVPQRPPPRPGQPPSANLQYPSCPTIPPPKPGNTIPPPSVPHFPSAPTIQPRTSVSNNISLSKPNVPLPTPPSLPPVPSRSEPSEEVSMSNNISSTPNLPPIPSRSEPSGVPPPVSRASKPMVAPTLTRAQTAPTGIQRTNPEDNQIGEAIDTEKTQTETNGHRFLLIPIKSLYYYSASLRPDYSLRETEVAPPLGNDLLGMLTAPPVLAYQFEKAYCYELLFGKLFDANGEFFPLQEKPKKKQVPFFYRVDVYLASEVDQAKGTFVGQIQMHRIDKLNESKEYEIIPLHKELPCLTVRQGVYMFRAAGPRFFIINLPEQVTFHKHQEFDGMLMKFGLLQRLNPKGKVTEDNSINSAAAVIGSGGQTLGKGLAKGSELLGKGMRKGSQFYTSRAKKHEPSTPAQSDAVVTQNGETAERKGGLETAEKASTVFVTGSRGLGVGIRKGFGFVGRTGATIVDGSAKTVKNTEWYKEREEKANQNKSEDQRESNLTGVGNVAKSSINAGSSVISGFKQGTRTVAKDVRNTTVEIAQHSKGEEAGYQARQSFNIFGKTAIGASYCVSLTTIGTFHCVAYTGIGVATYDPDKQDVLEGLAWKVGWVTKQGSYLNPWSPRFAVLRTYSIAFYKNPKDSVPSSYIHTSEIRHVEKVDKSVTDKDFCFTIQTDSDLLYYSLDLGSEAKEEMQLTTEDLERDWGSWVNSIFALGRASEYSLLKKKYLD